uniref:Uncharacterized protein n=1 Tax=viral metagenome TaxID=1070528 RepID=A0A6C0J6G1_9ZZZZ
MTDSTSQSLAELIKSKTQQKVYEKPIKPKYKTFSDPINHKMSCIQTNMFPEYNMSSLDQDHLINELYKFTGTNKIEFVKGDVFRICPETKTYIETNMKLLFYGDEYCFIIEEGILTFDRKIKNKYCYGSEWYDTAGIEKDNLIDDTVWNAWNHKE